MKILRFFVFLICFQMGYTSAIWCAEEGVNLTHIENRFTASFAKTYKRFGVEQKMTLLIKNFGLFMQALPSSFSQEQRQKAAQSFILKISNFLIKGSQQKSAVSKITSKLRRTTKGNYSDHVVLLFALDEFIKSSHFDENSFGSLKQFLSNKSVPRHSRAQAIIRNAPQNLKAIYESKAVAPLAHQGPSAQPSGCNLLNLNREDVIKAGEIAQLSYRDDDELGNFSPITDRQVEIVQSVYESTNSFRAIAVQYIDDSHTLYIAFRGMDIDRNFWEEVRNAITIVRKNVAGKSLILSSVGKIGQRFITNTLLNKNIQSGFRFAHDVILKYIKSHPQDKIIITGQSLGGLYAQAVFLQLREALPALHDRLTAHVFQAPGLADTAYISRSRIKKDPAKHRKALPVITHLREGDPIGTWKHLGQTIWYPKASSRNPLVSHNIRDLLEGLRDKTIHPKTLNKKQAFCFKDE